jgi:hypothetical protein
VRRARSTAVDLLVAEVEVTAEEVPVRFDVVVGRSLVEKELDWKTGNEGPVDLG